MQKMIQQQVASTGEEVKLPEPDNKPKVEETVSQLTDVPNKNKEIKDIDALIPKDDYHTSALWHEVVSYFGVPASEWDLAKNEMSEIVEYVIREIEDNDPGKVLLRLREIEDTIQPPEWGLKRYKNIYRYIRLAARKRSAEDSMKAFEKREKQVNG